jgi:hypothetical protein
MNTMTISAEVRLQEAMALVAYLENRNLVLAQAAVKMTSERDIQIKALRDRVAELGAETSADIVTPAIEGEQS